MRESACLDSSTLARRSRTAFSTSRAASRTQHERSRVQPSVAAHGLGRPVEAAATTRPSRRHVALDRRRRNPDLRADRALPPRQPREVRPAGGIVNLGHGALVVSALGGIAAVIIGAVAGAGDLEAGVYRDLVVTGRSRLALYASRIPGGLAFLLPFVVTAYALAAVAAVVLAGSRRVPGVELVVTTGLWTLLEVVFFYLLAVAIASAIGSRAYTIGIALAWELAVSPILSSISALGIVRELVPDVPLESLAPAALGDTVGQTPYRDMALAAVVAVLLGWTVLAHVIGAWRDTTRDA
jgi:ABC-type transport system involved in multi-copper enzyme maturation permease subunit